MGILQAEMAGKRNASMKNLEFPFPYRKGQREMVAGVYHAVSSKNRFCTGAYRSGKNHVLCISFCSGNWRGKRGAAFLSYGKNYYQNRCSGCL